MPKYVYQGRTFDWSEYSRSRNRGISIHVEGVRGSDRTFMFAPNPHNNPAYNKRQAKFYDRAAEKAVAAYDPQTNQWGTPPPFEWEGVEYSFRDE